VIVRRRGVLEGEGGKAMWGPGKTKTLLKKKGEKPGEEIGRLTKTASNGRKKSPAEAPSGGKPRKIITHFPKMDRGGKNRGTFS